ncbi:MAG TPA: DNA mismatch repair protein MutS [Enhygromyxa sp.]|nr:DNA mismatch repair protein MutS [Enhygromyxa sp.]
MATPEPSHPEEADPRATPIAAYRERLAAREATLADLERRDARLSRIRLAVFLGFLALVIACWQLALPWSLLWIPALGFLVLVVVHERTLTRRDQARRAAAHYREGLDRCADRWAGKGVQTTDHVDAEHPFAADLDLFGEGSLFELLCRARTRAGEQRLASWLTIHAQQRVEVETIRARQRSVAALKDALDLREALAVLGVAARVEVRPEVLIDWGRAPSLFSIGQRRWLPIAGIALPILAGLGVAAWVIGFGPWLLAAIVLTEGAIYKLLGDTLGRVAGPADRRGHELGVLAQLFAHIEASRFEDPQLCELQRAFTGADQSSASAAIARLRTLAGWYEAQRNALFVPVALALMWGPNFALAIERWRREHGPRIPAWLDALAELEALASLASHAFENPDDPFPELVDEGPPVIEGEALGHPLLPRASCVRNDLALIPPVRAHVISGSNMSGKSTFLRTVGCNVVLALAGAPVRARSLAVSPLRIGATLRVQDSLREGASRFWAELTRLRTISELADAEPTLFLLDEIFHGTNSHDRRIGAEALLRSLLERGAIGLLTTHDLALAKAAEALAPAATNVHFEDELRDGQLVFDYRMRPGVVQKSNALELMRSVGLQV